MTENNQFFSIDGVSLSKFASSSRSCHFGQVCELEAKFGSVTFDFSTITADYCMIHTRRQSGNGIVSISVGDQNLEQNILSKLNHSIKIDLKVSKRVEISRPYRSKGNVEIWGVDFYTEKNVSKISKTTIDWANILRSCKEYKCLKISEDGRLFASEGGQIIANNILNISSHPPNMYQIYDNTTVKFLGPCEITNLEINSGDKIIKKQALYPHFDMFSPNNELISGQNILVTANQENVLKPSIINPKPIFDSAESGSLKLFKREDCEDIAGAIILKHQGKIIIPVSNLKRNHEYIVIIEANKKSGNGKLHAWVEPLETKAADLIFVAGHRKTLRMKITSGPNTSEEQQSVVVARPDSATGDVIIYRVIIIEGANIEHVVASLINNAITTATHTHPQRAITVTDDDFIYVTLKKYARYSSFVEPPITFEQLGGYCASTSMSGLKWINKINKIIPNIKLDNTSKYPIKLLFGTIDNLILAENIYLDEYDKLINTDILCQTKKIFTPSFENWLELKDKFNNIDVIHCAKPWPYVVPHELKHIKDNFMLLINRNEKITQTIVQLYNENNWPKPVILNARHNFGNNNIYLANDYLPYDNLLWLIENAVCIVDFDNVKNVKSSLLEIAISLGTPVVSNNWFLRDKPNSIFSLSDEWNGKSTIPSKQSIIKNINLAIQNLKKQMLSNNLNKILFNWVSDIFAK